MLQDMSISADVVTFVCLLQPCACIVTAALCQGKQLHAQVNEGGLEGDMVVGALIWTRSAVSTMLAKCLTGFLTKTC